MSGETPIRVLLNGCWDLIHVGHIWHIEQARKLGDELWVSVTDDLHVNKGPGRPVYPLEHRIAVLRALRCVDKVFGTSSLIEAIDFAKPHILVKGTDYRNGLHDIHEKYCADRGIRITFTDTPKLSATDFINDAIKRAGSGIAA